MLKSNTGKKQNDSKSKVQSKGGIKDKIAQYKTELSMVVFFIIVLIGGIASAAAYKKTKTRHTVDSLALAPKDNAEAILCSQDDAATLGHELFMSTRTKWDEGLPKVENLRSSFSDGIARLVTAIEIKAGVICAQAKGLVPDKCNPHDHNWCDKNGWWVTDIDGAAFANLISNGGETDLVDGGSYLGMIELINKLRNSYIDNKPLFFLKDADAAASNPNNYEPEEITE